MDVKQTLFTLCEAVGIGTIDTASKKTFEILSDLAECEKLNGLTVVGYLKGNSDYTIMLDAHIDEVGMIVTDIDDDGFLTVNKCGGIDIRTLPSRPVTVHGKRDVTAVFCSTPPHLTEKEAEFSDISKIKLDTLLGGEAKNIISIGDYVTYSTKPVELLNRRITSKSLDDRAGVACLLCLAERLSKKELPVNVAFLLSDSEELGLRGAKTASFKVSPDEAIAIDVSFGDGPDISPTECGKLGKGAMIGVSPTLNKVITNRLIDIAKQNKIPYQTEVMGGNTSTNADAITLTKGGVKTGLVSIPLRNMHTDIEVVDLADLEAVIDILEKYILSGGVLNA